MATLVIFHRLALREYQAAQRWYARRGGIALAQSFQDEIERAVQQIAHNPSQWPIAQGPYRWIRPRRFPYVLYYRTLDANHVLIVAVAHARRRPGYWLRRSRP